MPTYIVSSQYKEATSYVTGILTLSAGGSLCFTDANGAVLRMFGPGVWTEVALDDQD